MSDRAALGELAALLREVATRLDNIAPRVTEEQARIVCDLLEAPARQLGEQLAIVQKGDWIYRQ